MRKSKLYFLLSALLGLFIFILTSCGIDSSKIIIPSESNTTESTTPSNNNITTPSNVNSTPSDSNPTVISTTPSTSPTTQDYVEPSNPDDTTTTSSFISTTPSTSPTTQDYVEPSNPDDTTTTSSFISTNEYIYINDRYSSDSTHHWHDAMTRYTEEKLDYEAHDFEIEIEREATCGQTGRVKKTCKICGRVITDTIDKLSHTFDLDTWAYNETNHYHPATCGHNNQLGATKHVYGSSTEEKEIDENTKDEYVYAIRECTVCGYKQRSFLHINYHEHTYSDSYLFDDTWHWHSSTCGHDVNSNFNMHNMTEEKIQEESETQVGIIRHSCSLCDYYYDETIDKLDYEFVENQDGTYTIKSFGTITPKSDFIIPTEHNGKAVSRISNGLFGSKTFNNVNFGSNIKNIDYYTFSSSKITNLYYDGTLEDWCSISFGSIEANPMYCTTNFYIQDDNGKVEYNNKKYSLLIDLIIPDSILIIKENAFAYLKQLESIKFHNNLEKISAGAFSNCEKITEIIIPEKTVVQNSSVFYGTSIERATVSAEYAKTIPVSLLEEINIAYGNIINSYTCSDAHNLKTIIISDSVTDIYSYSFRNCENIEVLKAGSNINSVGVQVFTDSIINYAEIPATIARYLNNVKLTKIKIISGTKISNSSFSTCENLKEIELCEGIKTIEAYSFFRCKDLNKIILPESLVTIEDNAFNWCYNLLEIYNLSNIYIAKESSGNGNIGLYAKAIHNSLDEESVLINTNDYILQEVENKIHLLRYIGNETDVIVSKNYNFDGKEYVIDTISKYAFSFVNVINVTFDNAIINYEGYIFANNNKIENVIFSNLITILPEYTFYNCGNLKTINCSSLIEVKEYACCNSVSLINIITNDNTISKIDNGAFAGCSSLTSFKVCGDEIDNSAFSGCYKLFEIYNTSATTFTLGSQDYGYIAYYAKIIHNSNSTKSIIVNENDYIFAYVNNKGYLLEYLGLDTELLLPNSFTYNGSLIKNYEIAEYAFIESGITSITIPSSVTSIGKAAFISSNLEEVIINNGLQVIGDNAFSGTKITSIIIPDSVTSIGKSAFSGCRELQNVTISKNLTSISEFLFSSCYKLNDINIRCNITAIDNSAFNSCYGLTQIILPYSLENINQSAFYDCYNLKTVYFKGSKELWDRISIANSNDYLQNSNIIYNYAPSYDYEFEWSNDYTSATLVLTSKEDGSVNRILIEEIIKNITDSTLTLEGEIEYVAEITYEGIKYTDKKYETIPVKINELNYNDNNIIINIDVTGVIDGNTVIDANELSSDELNEKISSYLTKASLSNITSKVLSSYDIKLMIGSNVAQFDNEFMVTINVNSDILNIITKLLHIHSETEYELIDFTKNLIDSTITFEVNKFSEFVLIHEHSSNQMLHDSLHHYYSCDICNEVYNSHDHTEVVDNSVAPTCTTSGLTQGSHCSVCGYIIETQENVSALGHDYSIISGWIWNEYSSAKLTLSCSHDETHTIELNAIVTSAITTKATCTSKGIKTYTAKVEYNGNIYTDTKTEEINALGHLYTVVSGWTWNGVTSAKLTLSCSHDETHTIELDSIIESSITKTVTCDADGERTYTAEVEYNGNTYTDIKTIGIDAIGHDYSIVGDWTWNEYTSAKLTLSCSHDETHTIELNSTITSTITKVATCDTIGERTYTAKVEYNGNIYTDTKTEEINALGHRYNIVLDWTWTGNANDNNVAVTLTLGCSRDSSHIITLDAELTTEIIQNPTCEVYGEILYTAKVNYNNTEYSDINSYNVNALGHDFDFEFVWDENTPQATVTATCKHNAEHVYVAENYVAELKEVTKEATCTETGVAIYEISINELINKKDYNDGTGSVQIVSGFVCSDTHEYVLPKTKHHYGEWETITEPTNDTDGLKQKTCSICGHTKDYIIKKLSDTDYWNKIDISNKIKQSLAFENYTLTANDNIIMDSYIQHGKYIYKCDGDILYVYFPEQMQEFYQYEDENHNLVMDGYFMGRYTGNNILTPDNDYYMMNYILYKKLINICSQFVSLSSDDMNIETVNHIEKELYEIEYVEYNFNNEKGCYEPTYIDNDEYVEYNFKFKEVYFEGDYISKFVISTTSGDFSYNLTNLGTTTIDVNPLENEMFGLYYDLGDYNQITYYKHGQSEVDTVNISSDGIRIIVRYDENLNNVVIPDSYNSKNITQVFFGFETNTLHNGMSINNITIGSNIQVLEIVDELENIYFEGTSEEWENINLVYNPLNASTYYNRVNGDQRIYKEVNEIYSYKFDIIEGTDIIYSVYGAHCFNVYIKNNNNEYELYKTYGWVKS